MTTITLPRATVEQALEALEYHVEQTRPIWKTSEAIAALEAALAQQAEPRNQCRSDGRCQYAIDHGAEGIGHCPKSKCVMAQHTQPAEDRDVAQSNLRVMKEMFREQTEPAQQAEPVEPVAWMYTGIKQDGTEHGPHLVWKPEYMDAMSASKGAKAKPLYTAPPPRKPLTDEEIVRLMVGEDRVQLLYAKPGDPYFSEFAEGAIRELVDSGRAIERAHGIGEEK